MGERTDDTKAKGKGNGSGVENDSHQKCIEDRKRTVIRSKDSPIHSARSFPHNSSSHLGSLQDYVPHAISQFNTYENAFFNKVKEELLSAREHPAAAIGVAVTASLLLMRGPRRFLFRHTLGQLQSEEAQFLKAEKNVKEFNFSVDLMKKESRKLLERAALAEKDVKHGHNKLLDAGSQIQRLAKSVCNVETQALDLMDGLCEIPGREALKFRVERQRIALDKRIMRISELGVPV